MSSTQQLILGEGAGGAPAAYQIERSLRFNSADNAYLNRTFGTSTNQYIFTYSAWVKLARAVEATTNYGVLIAARTASTDAGYGILEIYNGVLRFTGWSTVWRSTTQVFRDPSAWYHIVLAVDTTQATAANRIKIYLNGNEITAFGTSNNPNQNTTVGINNNSTASRLGNDDPAASSRYFDGYLTEINFIDGQALTPSSFGQTNASTGVWEPIKYTGSYSGTNSFYLNFSDNSNTTSTTLGKDSSGNGNNWTPNGFSVTAGTGNDSLVDTPTPYGTDTGAGGEVRGNYCTLNPLDSGVTVVNGNLDFVYVAANRSVLGTVGMRTGKFRWEFTPSAANNNFDLYAGVIKSTSSFNKNANECRYNAGAYAVAGLYGGSTQVRPVNNNTFGTLFGWTWTNGDILGLYFDATNGTLKANQNGGSLVTVYTGLTTGIDWLPVFSDGSISSATHVTNFGQRPFAYASAESGYQALCTQNLPTPTIGATSTTQANDYFNVVTYTGTGTTNAITGVGFNPDFLWIKTRSNAVSHALYNKITGVTKFLTSNTTAAEATSLANRDLLSFDADGFTVGQQDHQRTNENTYTYVAWNWKANGAGSSNTDGTITSTVSASTTAGFSIVTYTGTGANATVGHGLGVAPSMIIVKNRSSATDWAVYHASLPSAAYWLELNTTGGQQGPNAVVFNSTAPTSTVFSVGTNDRTNTNNHVAYCFAAVAGYSAFGSYTGNGSTDGPFVYTGFRPAFVLMKVTSTTDSWVIVDRTRSPYNVAKLTLFPNLSNAENDGAIEVDMLSNGFKLRTANSNVNASQTFIYAAFAEFPFKYTLAR